MRGIMKKLTNDEFIKKSNLLHSNYYNYIKTRYTGSMNKTTITCPIHGDFEQTPNVHLSGKGCPKCGISKRVLIPNRTQFIEFCKTAHRIWSDKYEYSNYTGVTNKLTVKCIKHNYTFIQKGKNHLDKHEGCKACISEMFIEKAKKRYDNKYNYNLIPKVFKPTEKQPIVCPKHGVFYQRLSTHYSKGLGCRLCANEHISSVRSDTPEDFVVKAKLIHKNKYDYSVNNFTTSRSKVTIICPNHGTFTQNASAHLSGSGCPDCVNRCTFQYEKPAILYYLSINNGQAYKIGITNRNVKSRYKRDYKNIKILCTWQFIKGKDAYLAEQNILKKYKKFKYKGTNLLKDAGNTELFKLNILALIKKEIPTWHSVLKV